jgi:hypothetical protein
MRGWVFLPKPNTRSKYAWGGGGRHNSARSTDTGGEYAPDTPEVVDRGEYTRVIGPS